VTWTFRFHQFSSYPRLKMDYDEVRLWKSGFDECSPLSQSHLVSIRFSAQSGKLSFGNVTLLKYRLGESNSDVIIRHITNMQSGGDDPCHMT
jgi:hypothetical protein